MYLWLTRLIVGHVVGEASNVPGVAFPIEYHGFTVPGSKRVPVIAPNLDTLLPWVLCAARLARRAAGTPACADMRFIDVQAVAASKPT